MSAGPLEIVPGPDGRPPSSGEGAGGARRIYVDYEALARTLPMGLLIHRGGTILFANQEAARVLKLDDPADLVGGELLEILPAEVRERVADEVRRVQEEREVIELSVYPVTRGDGTDGHVEAMAVPVDHRGEPAVQVMFRDVTDRVETERELAASRQELEDRERRYRQLVEATDVIPWELRVSDWTFTYVAPQAEKLFGYDREAWYEPGFWPEHIHPEDRDRAVRFCRRQTGEGRDHEFEYRLVHSDGHPVWVQDIVSVVEDADGPDLLRGVMIDISERKRIEQELERKALHDEVTGLANRTLFWDRLEHAIARCRREGGDLAVVFADLDRFKVVNDSLGHAAGDRVLVEVARRLESVFRAQDTVARFGGDEFTVLLEDPEGEEAVEEAVRRFLRRLDEPFRVEGETVHLSASVGIALAQPLPPDRSLEDLREELVRRADAAMFRAKNRPRAAVHVFDPDDDVHAAGHLERERELREAIEADQFVCRYQPILDLESGRVVGVEPLARWEHPERGTVAPAEFIPLAEETGLVVPLDERLLEIACRTLAGRDDPPGTRPPLVVHKNLSAHQFDDPGLASHVRELLEETGIDPHRIRFEVTERTVMRKSDRVDELTALGVGVVIDDFGTGYSSLRYLKDLDVEALKIDMSFVHGLGESPEDEAIVRTIVTLGETLDLEVVAEGIETEEQLRVLRACGCRLGQGYLLAPPMTDEELGEFLESRAGD